MINLSTSGNAVVFTFTDSDKYLYGTGTITVPLNSLLLVTDSSNMATFKKAASNDVFVSALYSELGMTKDELISWYKDNMVGGGGSVDSGTVESMISEATSGKADTSAVTESINAAVSGKADSSWVSENFVLSSTIDAINPVSWNNDVTQSVSSASTDSEIPTAKAVWDAIPASITVDTSLDSGSTNPVANSAITDHLNTVESVIATSLVDLDTRKQDTLIAGSGITIDSANTISCTGGGTTYTAGKGISISSDTISVSLPISGGNYDSLIIGSSSNSATSNSVAIGSQTKAVNNSSFAGGYKSVSNAQYGMAFGYGVESNGNESQIVLGRENEVKTANGYTGTVFIVGNGYGSSNRHNALEINQRGEIYIPDTRNVTNSNWYTLPMINLQDYTRYKIVKLSQADYDALVQAGTVDANTVYFITNSNS